MFPLDYLVAAALLAAPPGSEDPPGSADTYLHLAPTIQELAVAWEILDPREARYLLVRRDDYRSDINLLRQRFHELLDAPPLPDCMRFPPRQMVSELLSFNRSYKEHLEKCRVAGATPDPDFDETLAEVDCLYHLWDAIRDSRCEYYYVTVRRQALKKVRDTVGEEAFYNGNFPPHVPLWRFRRID
jgi:hypothetical protein